MDIKAQAAFEGGSILSEFSFPPRALGPWDVELNITHCGVCHSDIHLIDNDMGMSSYPLVPGHEIVGEIIHKGSEVVDFVLGDRVGIGWQCSACLQCEWCNKDEEQNCAKKLPTCVSQPGGFADRIISDSRFAFKIPEKLSSERAAPLLCGGVTVYSPLKYHNMGAGNKVAIIGLGGLGHMAVQFANALGCEVTVISSSSDKEKEASSLGAHHFICSKNKSELINAVNSFDFILSTAPADYDWSMIVSMLKTHGKLCFVGFPPHAVSIPSVMLIRGERSICGSNIGSRKTIREMLKFAAENDLGARVELFPLAQVNDAIQKLKSNKVHYRAVLVM